MEYQINHIPFKITEITSKLFNSEFFSDVIFMVEDKYIYAHSLILMVRSSVFQKQLETTVGEKKIIPITDYGYDAFYQLIKFIYTDQVDISKVNQFNLLKLANQYNVVRLVNDLLNSCFDMMKKFNFFVMENYQVGLNCVKLMISKNAKSILNSNEFLSNQPEAVGEILKFNEIESGVTETNILDALVRWMKQYCVQNQIHFSECRQKFEHFIRLIRFPTVSNDELRDIKTKYPDLLTKSDFMNIAGHKIYGDECDEGIWKSTLRKDVVWPYVLKEYPDKSKFETRFSVSTDMILGGFVVGRDQYFKDKRINVTIFCGPRGLDEATQININDLNLGDFYSVISLGSSIRVRPNVIYTICYKYDNTEKTTEYRSRRAQTELFINGAPKSVKIIEAHATMFEICFYQPEDVKTN